MTDSTRKCNLDLLGNWVTEDGTPAVHFSHDCSARTQDRTTNNLNQVATTAPDGGPSTTLSTTSRGTCYPMEC